MDILIHQQNVAYDVWRIKGGRASLTVLIVSRFAEI
jgi:hypothetical protein